MKENIFQQIQDDNTAYWLGFLAADGSIHHNKLEIGLSIKDIEHLYKFKNFIDYEGEIVERKTLCSNNGKYYPSCYISIRNKNIIDYLSQYQIVPDKSHKNIDFLNYIPEKYKIPFILGLFDGDGWFTKTENMNFGICGNQATIYSVSQYLLNYFNWNILNNHQYVKSKITFYFSTSSSQKLLDFISLYLSYENKCDLLKRKKDIAIFLKNKIEYNQQIKKIQKNKNIEKQKFKNIPNKICPICNMSFFGRAEQKYCSQVCAHKEQQKCERPSRDVLKQEIRKVPFVQLGKKYGVSDKAISKWCIAYNLPNKKKDINFYSDEEWDKL